MGDLEAVEGNSFRRSRAPGSGQGVKKKRSGEVGVKGKRSRVKRGRRNEVNADGQGRGSRQKVGLTESPWLSIKKSV